MMHSSREDYESNEYKAWRNHVYGRDQFSCQICHRSGIPLQAHHIVRWADAPHLRYVVNNGITLCCECHTMVTGKEDAYIDQFQKIVALRNIKKNKRYKTSPNKTTTIQPRNYKWRPRNPNLRY